MKDAFIEYLRSQIGLQCSVFHWHMRLETLTERIVIERTGKLSGIMSAGFALDLLTYEEFHAFRIFVDLLGDELLQDIQKQGMEVIFDVREHLP